MENNQVITVVVEDSSVDKILNLVKDFMGYAYKFHTGQSSLKRGYYFVIGSKEELSDQEKQDIFKNKNNNKNIKKY